MPLDGIWSRWPTVGTLACRFRDDRLSRFNSKEESGVSIQNETITVGNARQAVSKGPVGYGRTCEAFFYALLLLAPTVPSVASRFTEECYTWHRRGGSAV